ICGTDSTSTVDGGNIHQLFSVSEAELHLLNLTLSNGNASESGGAINAIDSLVTVESCVFEDNVAEGSSGA
ncbi:unnamed protein product, partial [Choristocarpus tenellus]